MNDIDITLFLNEYRVKALEEALGNRTAETIEDKLSEAFDVLYQEYVDDEQRASIEAKIECEEAAEQARIEAKRRFAVYHVRENGEDYHLQVIISVHQCRQPIVTGFMIGTSLSANPQTLTAAFIETNPISLKKFNDACTDINSDKRITALVEFDLDEGRVSVCDNSDNEWQTFTLHDFSVAAYKAYRSDYRSEDCRREIFNSSLAGKEIDSVKTENEVSDEDDSEDENVTMSM